MRETRGLFDGLRIGLLGGSFNPPHQGHFEITLTALRKLQLDCVWWLVTPGNPQKNTRSYAAKEIRIQAATRLAWHPRIHISDFESHHGLVYTADTLSKLRQLFPQTRFVWLMGADNMASFHTWYAWKKIASTMPLAVFNRPGHKFEALASPAAQYLARFRVPPECARNLPHCEAPAWSYFVETNNGLTSTGLRHQNPNWASTLTVT